MKRMLVLAVAAMIASAAAAAPAPTPMGRPPARPAVDAPELAKLGPYAVGVSEVVLVQKDQLDTRADGPPRSFDRRLPVTVWYPARKTGGRAAVYASTLTDEHLKPTPFRIPGVAVRGAPAAEGSFPMVVLIHGTSGSPATVAYLGENLASKGYVVVAPFCDDPPYGTGGAWVGTRRPLDVAFAAAEAQARARAGQAPFAHIDPERSALIGYSAGGYGAFAGAGAQLDPAVVGPASKGVLAPFAAGGPRAAELKIHGVKAVVGIAPPRRFFGDHGVEAVTAPALYIAGDQDRLVNYTDSVRRLFDGQAHAPRYLLTYRNAGHNIGMSMSPPEMTHRLWDQDWFEDPVWRKERIVGVTLHFVTAFLDRYVKEDTAKEAWLKLALPDSNLGTWDAPKDTAWDAYSPGPPATLWKGFQRNHAAGMIFEFKPPSP